MKQLYLIFLFLNIVVFTSKAQVFDVDTLLYNGNTNKYINLVLMGDGYTSSQQNTFISDANNMVNHLFNQSPWNHYKNYFNLFAIKVVSNQSGATHPATASDCSSASPQVPVSSPSTYFDCRFDAYGIHRLVVPNNYTNISNVLSTNFPNYDQVIIISNSSYYGGSGGTFSTTTTNANSNEICAHEVGHSFANLADEYYAGDSYAGEKANMTQQTNTSLVKWSNWIGNNGIGIYQHCCGGQSANWYRPHENCKMRYLGSPFCDVCSETIIEKIHALVNTIVAITPTTTTISSTNAVIDFKLTSLMLPNPNTLKITWKLDGNLISNNVDSVQINQNSLSNGTHTLIATVTDTTSLSRINNHSTTHFNSVTWTINKSISGIKTSSELQKITYSVYPNPSSSFINIRLESDKAIKNLTIQITDINGKVVEEIKESYLDPKVIKTINVENLTSGNYFITIKTANTEEVLTFIKQ